MGGKPEEADAEEETDAAEEVKKHAFFEHINWQDLYDKKVCWVVIRFNVTVESLCLYVVAPSSFQARGGRGAITLLAM